MKPNEVIQYLEKLTKTRKRLIAKGKSRADIVQVEKDINHIRIHLAYNQGKYTPVGIAKFFLRNEHRIRNIIPGPGSGSHDKLMKEFHQIKFHCESTVETGQCPVSTKGKDKAPPCLNGTPKNH